MRYFRNLKNIESQQGVLIEAHSLWQSLSPILEESTQLTLVDDDEHHSFPYRKNVFKEVEESQLRKS